MEISIIEWLILIVLTFTAVFYIIFSKQGKENKVLIILTWIACIGTMLFLFHFPSDGKKLSSENYFLGIAQMLGGLLTVIGIYLTIKQEEKIRKSDEKNYDNKIKEQLRLENLPVLKFSTNNDEISNSGVIKYIDCTEEEDTYHKQLNINIKNVGLGSAQNIYFQIIIGIENNDSKMGNVNQILEPKDEFTETIYFRIPKEKNDLNKRITIVVFYSDLLNNNYVQVLDGNIGITRCESDGIVEYNPGIYASANNSYERIGENYKYELPEEVVESEKNRIEYEKKQEEIRKRITDEKIEKINEITSEYFLQSKYLEDIIKEQIKTITICSGCGDTEDYELVRKNIYRVKLMEMIGISQNEDIKCVTDVLVNIQTGNIKTINKKVYFVKPKKINKFIQMKIKRIIKKELKKQQKKEKKLYNF